MNEQTNNWMVRQMDENLNSYMSTLLEVGVTIQAFVSYHIVCRESKPRNSYFYQTTFCQHRNTKRIAHILSNSCSSRPIRTPLKNINHASKYRIYEK